MKRTWKNYFGYIFLALFLLLVWAFIVFLSGYWFFNPFVFFHFVFI